MNKRSREYGKSLRMSKAAGSPRGDKKEAEQKKELENKATEEHKGKFKPAAEEVKGDTKTETPSKTKEVGDKKAADQRAVDSKPTDELEGFASATEEQGRRKKNLSSGTLSDFEKIWTEKDKIKVTEEAKGDTQAATPSKSKVVGDKKAADQRATDCKPADKLEGFACAKEDQSSEKKMSSDTPFHVLKTDSAVIPESVRLGKHSSKQGVSTEKAIFVSAPPLPADLHIGKILDVRRRNANAMQIIQALDKNENKTREQSENINTCNYMERCKDTDHPHEYKILKVQQILCSEKEKETTALSQVSKDTDEQKLISEQSTSKSVSALPSKNEKKPTKTKAGVDVTMQKELLSEKKGTGSAIVCKKSYDIDERKRNLEQKASGVQQKISSENNSVSELIPLKSSTDTNKNELNLEMEILKVFKDFSLENKKALKTKTEEFKSRNFLQCSENIHGQKQSFHAEVEQELSSKNVKVSESTHLLQSSEDDDKLKQDLDIEVSPDPSSENEQQVVEIKPEESESSSLNQCSQDIDCRKQNQAQGQLSLDNDTKLTEPKNEANVDLQAQGQLSLDNDTKLTEPKIEANETTCSLQDSKHMDIDERI